MEGEAAEEGERTTNELENEEWRVVSRDEGE
jgi:hypothetical protein